jgi:tRNA (guanine26-N2/guanine27-N2)-dimethyltransferase
MANASPFNLRRFREEKWLNRLGYPTEVVNEGKTSIVVPMLEAYKGEACEYAPSKAPVFFNPAMELNRDIAVLVLQAYQRTIGKQLSACEPLAGCGIRGVRFANEVQGIRKIVLSDLNPKAVELARLNVERHKLEKRIKVIEEEANLLLSRHAAPRKRFNYVDVDPFGSPAPYLDSAVRALRDGGLIALTATDLAPLCGVHPHACIRKYGGKPLRTEYCHELAVRLLIGCLATTAAKHDIGIQPVLSHSTQFYIRTYAFLSYGARKADASIQEMGFILHCFKCLHRETSKGIASHSKRKCPVCGYSLTSAGPLWLGKISGAKLCAIIKNEAAERTLKQKNRILKLLNLIKNEMDASVTYYVTDKISGELNLPPPALTKIVSSLEKAGFQAVPTHFNTKGIKTNAPAEVVKDVVSKIAGSSEN